MYLGTYYVLNGFKKNLCLCFLMNTKDFAVSKIFASLSKWAIVTQAVRSIRSSEPSRVSRPLESRLLTVPTYSRVV